MSWLSLPHRVVQTGDIVDGGNVVPATTDLPVSATVPSDVRSGQLERKNRMRTRGSELLAAIAKLDTEPDPLARHQIMEWIQKEYDDRGGGILMGLFSRCYLGPPYIDHAMTVNGYICEHYTRADEVPPLYRGSRALAANPAYEYVEVYGDGAVIPIRSNGKP
ncbi:MAG: hypothetical protein KF761_13945 [Salinibacterium sp.]|nr:hypothetical protein [Salinibacterium sp.]